MVIVCENTDCKKEFEFNNDSLKEKDLGKGIKQIYFNCQHCGQEYLVTKTSKEIEDLQKKIDYYADRAAGIKNDSAKKIDILNHMNDCIAEKKRHMEMLNKKELS